MLMVLTAWGWCCAGCYHIKQLRFFFSPHLLQLTQTYLHYPYVYYSKGCLLCLGSCTIITPPSTFYNPAVWYGACWPRHVCHMPRYPHHDNIIDSSIRLLKCLHWFYIRYMPACGGGPKRRSHYLPKHITCFRHCCVLDTSLRPTELNYTHFVQYSSRWKWLWWQWLSAQYIGE